MNKSELISSVAERSGLTKKDSEKALAAIIDSIVEAVKEDDKVQLIGFGTFELRSRSERAGRDPRTNKPITIPACKVPAFKAGKGFKDAVSGR